MEMTTSDAAKQRLLKTKEENAFLSIRDRISRGKKDCES